MGFTEGEHNSLQEFFEGEVRKNEAKEIVKTFNRLFKEIKNEKLRKYMIESITRNKSLDFTAFN